MALLPPLARMQTTGVPCVPGCFATAVAAIDTRIAHLNRAAVKAAGMEFLITSPKQVAEVRVVWRAVDVTARCDITPPPPLLLWRRCCSTT
jgi:hypothetical protein